MFEFGVAVDASDTGLRHPLAVNVSGFNFAFERVPVVELEAADFGVVGVFEEEWLAVASVLHDSSAFRVHSYSYVHDQHTLPVAPQHASRASSITTSGVPEDKFSSLPPSLFRRWRAILVPVIPLPMITTSAVDGKLLVDR